MIAPIRVLVVDDHAAVRAGLREMLDDQPDLCVVDAVAGAEVALSVAERSDVDVAVVDYHLERRDGLWVSRKLKRLPRPPRVLIYSAYADGLLGAAAVVAEADGVVSKASFGKEVCEAIRAVHVGARLLPPVPPGLAPLLRSRLDHDEQAIFGMMLAGIEPDHIARTLGLSPDGLEGHLWRMLQKLDDVPAGFATNGRARAV
jgi:DNA-binding NarL/FixJ family response regulator